MISPTSNKDREPRKYRKTKKVYHNQKFYTSKAWRGLRTKYIQDLTDKQYQDIQTVQIYTDKNIMSCRMYLLSQVPICERCYTLYINGAYTKVDRGIDLDHINPVNPDNALDCKGWGEPLNEDNLQLLCKAHHNKKTLRDNRIITKKQKDDKARD